MAYFHANFRIHVEGDAMAEKTCAACDCELDASSIEVRVGDTIVEVCCDVCALQLNEAQVSAVAPGSD